MGFGNYVKSALHDPVLWFRQLDQKISEVVVLLQVPLDAPDLAETTRIQLNMIPMLSTSLPPFALWRVPSQVDVVGILSCHLRLFERFDAMLFYHGRVTGAAAIANWYLNPPNVLRKPRTTCIIQPSNLRAGSFTCEL